MAVRHDQQHYHYHNHNQLGGYWTVSNGPGLPCRVVHKSRSQLRYCRIRRVCSLPWPLLKHHTDLRPASPSYLLHVLTLAAAPFNLTHVVCTV